MKYIGTFVLGLSMLTLAMTESGLAQIPRTLSYQGVLTDSSGNTPRPDGNFQFTFRLYDSTAMIWSETKTLQTKRGLFSTALGDATPFGSAVKFDKPYSLGIQIQGEPNELTPRILLTSVGYSMNALRADTAMVAITDGAWTPSGPNIYRAAGRVGIGTASPGTKLHVSGGNLKVENDAGNPTDFVVGNQNTGSTNLAISTSAYSGGNIRLQSISREGSQFGDIILNPSGGDVGVGNSLVWGDRSVLSRDQGGSIELGSTNSASTGTPFIDFHSAGGSTDYNVRIINDQSAQLSILAQRVRVTGRTITSVLEITGGMDLAEPFEMSHSQALEPGSVVVIDEDNPGKLKLSNEPYDKRVAGVVSGAGGVNPGLTLKQEGLMENGQNVALSGRVYVKATTTNGAIKPGDLLTTSNVAGYAMRASDESVKPGVTIGKAMSVLENGEGLVLVLVNLQ